MAGTFLHRTLGLIAAAGIGLLSLLGAAAAQGQDCAVPTSFYDTEPTLPKTAGAIAGGQTVSIVAIGGASTLGRAAGSPDLAWPARLAVALTNRFPAARVTVDNRAVARQTTQEMASRLEREVIAAKPTLVIWETGTMDAVRSTELDAFRQTIQAGIDRLRASGAEVALMDMQFSRRTHTVIINFDRYESVLREVTDAKDVPLFRRHDIMRHWAASGLFDLITGDHEKLRLVASHLYDCIGRAVADFVTRGIQPEAGAPAASSGSHK
ncbi:MAG: SGNH/GDSL hydrolase family protein [Candidatus Entotheonellia bacterium]